MLLVETPRRPPVAAAAVIGTTLVVLTAGVIAGRGMRLIAPVALGVVLATIVLPRLLSWRAQLATIVVIILFIPMKFYGLPASLPIRLEPYRLVVAAVLVVWLTSTLIDRRVRLRRTHVVDLPLAGFLFAIVVSEAMNRARFSSVETDAIKGLLFFASIIAVFFMVVSLVRTLADVDFIVRVLTGCGVVVAFFALIEANTGYNVFHHLSQFFPFLRVTGGGERDHERGAPARIRFGRTSDRAFGVVRHARTVRALSCDLLQASSLVGGSRRVAARNVRDWVAHGHRHAPHRCAWSTSGCAARR